jgi:hypothetical protein
MAIDPRRGAGGAGASCRESAARNVEQNVDVAESRSAGGAGGPTSALIHIGRPGGDGRGRSDNSPRPSVCLVLQLAYDRPFAVGGVTITPAAFREIMVD